MKQHLSILLLILALPFTGHAASEYTITKKHRVIQEASLQPSNVPIGTKISRLTFTNRSPHKDPSSSRSSQLNVQSHNATRCV